MPRTLIVLAVVLSGLVGIDLALTASAKRARRESLSIGRLVSSEQSERLKGNIAAIELRNGEDRWVFGQSFGTWRCHDHYRAIASSEALEQVVTQLFDAEGIIQSDDPAHAGDYGFSPGSTWHLVLHGRRAFQEREGRVEFVGEPLFQVDVGRSIEGQDGCYARLAGRDAVWAVDTNPRALLEPEGSAYRPPLLDPALVPAVWPGTDRRVQQIEIETASSSAMTVGLVPKALTDQERAQGVADVEWGLVRSGMRIQQANPGILNYYAAFVLIAPWAAVIGYVGDLSTAEPELLETFGLDRPSGRLTITAPDGQGSCVLVFGAPAQQGIRAVWNSATGQITGVTGEIAQMLLPPETWLTTDSQGNPWEEYFRRMQGR